MQLVDDILDFTAAAASLDEPACKQHCDTQHCERQRQLEFMLDVAGGRHPGLHGQQHYSGQAGAE